MIVKLIVCCIGGKLLSVYFYIFNLSNLTSSLYSKLSASNDTSFFNSEVRLYTLLEECIGKTHCLLSFCFVGCVVLLSSNESFVHGVPTLKVDILTTEISWSSSFYGTREIFIMAKKYSRMKATLAISSSASYHTYSFVVLISRVKPVRCICFVVLSFRRHSYVAFWSQTARWISCQCSNLQIYVWVSSTDITLSLFVLNTKWLNIALKHFLARSNKAHHTCLY